VVMVRVSCRLAQEAEVRRRPRVVEHLTASESVRLLVASRLDE